MALKLSNIWKFYEYLRFKIKVALFRTKKVLYQPIQRRRKDKISRPLLVEFAFMSPDECTVFLVPLWEHEHEGDSMQLDMYRFPVSWTELKLALLLLYQDAGSDSERSALHPLWLNLQGHELTKPVMLFLALLELSQQTIRSETSERKVDLHTKDETEDSFFQEVIYEIETMLKLAPESQWPLETSAGESQETEKIHEEALAFWKEFEEKVGDGEMEDFHFDGKSYYRLLEEAGKNGVFSNIPFITEYIRQILLNTIIGTINSQGYFSNQQYKETGKIRRAIFETLLTIAETSEPGYASSWSNDENTPADSGRSLFQLAIQKLIREQGLSEKETPLGHFRNMLSSLEDPENNQNQRKHAIERLFDEVPRELGRCFVEPWLEKIHELEPTELVIVPHGILHTAPLATAVLSDGLSLIDHYPVSIMPSAAIAMHIFEKSAKARSQRMELSNKVTLVVGPPKEAGLSYGEVEARKRLNDLSAERIIPGEVTKEQLAAYNGRIDILHIVSHSVFNFEKPFESYILLEVGERLTLRDILEGAVDLRSSRLVFLSSCHSAGSEPDVSDDVYSLAYGLIAAGARAVIATLWNVDDLISFKFSDYFYQVWTKNNLTLAESFQKAVQKIRKKNDVESFLNWGTFVLIGDGSIRYRSS